MPDFASVALADLRDKAGDDGRSFGRAYVHRHAFAGLCIVDNASEEYAAWRIACSYSGLFECLEDFSFCGRVRCTHMSGS